ncbi:hypothetical protein KL86DYS1_10203 [uncultured Dysgonomonas sp.]|uniref:Uncharacterized protein n=1 Tax=uncultured Dysgonomonas sp. TaxID=206096 RepID=A0A212IUP6_9BACT|nr:hypothetical protein KL86DYS1_10203 [uncultured Dysgonomonas sp.]
MGISSLFLFGNKPNRIQNAQYLWHDRYNIQIEIKIYNTNLPRDEFKLNPSLFYGSYCLSTLRLFIKI